MKHKALLYLLVFGSVLLTACGKKPKGEPLAQPEEKTTTVENVEPTEADEHQVKQVAQVEAKPKYNFGGEFDWSKIPVSTADIGSFPYVSAPKGMYHWQSDSINKPAPSDQPYSKKWDFSKLIMLDGKTVFDAEGKRAFLYVDMKDGAAFNQLLFDRSTDNYLKNIGAVKIFDEKVPTGIREKLDEKDGSTVFNYMTGDVWNEPIKMYALNHSAGKMFFQVISNSAHGEIGVIELEGFKQTIKAPTASEIKQQLDADGKAVLYINFDTDKATLKADGQKVVDEIGKLLEQNPALKLSIEGHTDNTGSGEHNQKLSTNRANTVMYALAGKGIDIARLKAEGFGDTKPMVANDTDENKAKNRRVELVKF